jgi:hypothetical protein
LHRRFGPPARILQPFLMLQLLLLLLLLLLQLQLIS